MEEIIQEKWGTVCWEAAPPAAVFYSFLEQWLGPSENGWLLNGTQWPDPPETIRFSPPDTKLKVTERWRCGDPCIDELRGIVPAQVEGMSVACPHQPHAVVPRGTPFTVALRPRDKAKIRPPLSNNPIAAIRGGLTLETIVAGESMTLPEAIQRFRRGQPVSRSSLLAMTLASTGRRVPTQVPKCYARALASPIFDDGQLTAFNSKTYLRTVKEGLKQQKFRRGPLDDAIVFETGEFQYACFYIWVHNRLLPLKTIVVAASNAKDNLLSEHLVTKADALPLVSFPASWIDAKGPWHEDVLLLAEMQGGEEQYTGVFVEIKGVPGADRVQIGLFPNSRQDRRLFTQRPFYVAAVELASTGEVRRQEWDQQEQHKSRTSWRLP